MNTQMSFEEKLHQIAHDFDEELQWLVVRQVLTSADVQKMRNQIEVSRNAMWTADRESSFSDQAKIKLRDALLQDFETSMQKYLDDAISRKGNKALLSHRLYLEDKRIARRSDELNIPLNDLQMLQIGLELLKSYILQTLPDKSFGGRMNVGQIVKTYEQTVLEYLKRYRSRSNLLR
jgi:hypothetical protein